MSLLKIIFEIEGVCWGGGGAKIFIRCGGAQKFLFALGPKSG